MRQWVFIGITFLVWAVNGEATEYMVANPASITAAAALPGDTLVMLTNGSWNNASLSFIKVGTIANPITLRAQVQGQVLITGDSHLFIGGTNLVVDGLVFTNGSTSQTEDIIQFRSGTSKLAKNCRLTNTSLIELNPATDTEDYKWVSLYGTSNRVDHCLFRGKRNSGATLTVWLPTNDIPNVHLIDHNYFDDRTFSGSNGGESMRIGDSSTSIYTSGTLVESNYFHACSGDPEVISSKSCDNVYRCNTFVNSQGCLVFRHGKRCTAIGNFFFGNGVASTGGIRIVDEGHTVVNNYFQDLRGVGARAALSLETGIIDSPLNGYFQVKNALVAFNTFVNCLSNIVISVDYGKVASAGTQVLSPRDCVFANNIVKGFANNLVYQLGFPTNLTWQGNIFFGGTLGMTLPAGNSFVDPLLSLAGDGLYRPVSNSPAIDAALGSYPNVVDDMDGQLRLGLLDVGADELSTDPVVRRPLQPGDVGPSALDADGDGIPNGWEWDNGLNPNDPADAASDFDGDGLTNLQEYRAGTNPRDARSALRITAVEWVGADLKVSFTSQSNKLYSIERVDSVSSTNWILVQDNISRYRRDRASDGYSRPGRIQWLLPGSLASMNDLLRLAQRVLSLPTAPYHEHAVRGFVVEYCRNLGLLVEEDLAGNVVAKYNQSQTGARARRSGKPPLVFVAHMDHPGFEMLGGKRAEFLGGVPKTMFARGVGVRVHGRDNVHRVRIARFVASAWPKRKLVDLNVARNRRLRKGDFGMWDLPAFRMTGNQLHAAAIDDVLGTVAMVATLTEISRRKLRTNVWCAFTRAEEVGFQGALALVRGRRIPKDAVVISIEMSKERPWARIGNGPVVRVGDRSTIFDPATTAFLLRAVERCRKREPRFRAQRCLMDGGSCEATVFMGFGYRAGGLCLPLGNYHNIGRNSRPRAEFVGVNDLERLVKLTVAAAEEWRSFHATNPLLEKRLLAIARNPPRRL